MEPNKGLHATAAIAGHPLHPLLVTLPIAFLIGAFLTDIGFFISGDPFWPRASTWLLGAGLLFGVIAALAGFIDFLGNERIRSLSLVRLHFGGNALALVIAALNFILRLNGPGTVSGFEFILSILVVLIFAVTGWLGGEMVFHYGVGHIDSRNGG
jgi:uncharacterized membrane protein